MHRRQLQDRSAIAVAAYPGRWGLKSGGRLPVRELGGPGEADADRAAPDARPWELVPRLHTYRQRSCASEGGTSFWAPTYSMPVCPRCGCQVSRYSEEGLFTDLDVANDEILQIQARKLGLRWRDGRLLNDAGEVVDDRDILDSLFSGERRSPRSIKAFEKLPQAGLTPVESAPVDKVRLLDNILSIELRPDQEEALQAFFDTGAMTAAHAMSFGKSTLGMMVLTRITGRHLLMVDPEPAAARPPDALRSCALPLLSDDVVGALRAIRRPHRRDQGQWLPCDGGGRRTPTSTVYSLLTPPLRQRVSAQENPYLSMLGWQKRTP